MANLTDLEKRILDFEGKWWADLKTKDGHIRGEFDVTATRYYQLLNGLIDRPEALGYAPQTVRRVLRRRAVGQEARRRQASVARQDRRTG